MGCTAAEFLAEDGTTALLLMNDKGTNRPFQIRYYEVGSSQTESKELWSEKDARYCVNLYTTRDNVWTKPTLSPL